MPDTYDLALTGADVVTPWGRHALDIGIAQGRIAHLGTLAPGAARETIACHGLTILPGVIDSQVHFREPGPTHKEDLETGSRAAVLGGVTAVFEMPNTNPPTTTAAALDEKLALARGRMWCDHAFYVGAEKGNAAALRDLEVRPGAAGVKVFMGSSTGNLLVDDDAHVREVLRNGRRRVAVHAEDEARLIARKALALAGQPQTHPVWRDAEAARLCTERLLKLARETRRRVHVLHVSTGDELPLLANAKDIATAETTPHHLTLTAPDCYERLGTYAQMNPPVRDKAHQDALWVGVRQGVIDVLGSDHAPHTHEEKDKGYPNTPSGMPGVQTLVPVMLTHVAAGRLSLERFADLVAHGPQRIFGLAGKGRIALGYDADFTIVDLKARRRIENRWIASRCGWSPYDGFEATGWPIMTMIRGRIVMRDDQVLGTAHGQPLRFLEAL
ncbi:MAG TPA: dihydroorotase [Alphaproteobacteria bacterium]|nr:dihydroorotase [Alphaproteobacteria bacterium]